MCTEFPSREAIAAHQLQQLRKLLQAVVVSNPFYSSRLEQAGLTCELRSLDDFFRNMPFTRKEEIAADQQSHPPYGTNLTFPLGAYNRFTQTSATNGVPLRWLDTPDTWQWMLDNWKQVLAAAEISPADSLYFAFSFGPFLGFWTAFEAACQMGCRCLPGGGLSSLARLQAMRDNAVDVLCCTPTYAIHLGHVAAEAKIDLASFAVRKIIVAGEPGGSVPTTREQIEKAWPRATVFDHHGMTEVGPVTYQCPGRPCTLMVIESSYIAEIVDPGSDKAVSRGEVGELVLTTLGRVGSPLIRYRTGDLVRENLDIASREGRHEMALRGGILGRADDMILVRGVNLYPAAVENLILSLPDVAAYQVEVDTRGPMVELRLHVEPSAATSDQIELAIRVQSQFRAAFNLRVPVTVRTPGTLPRGEMKSRRWIRRNE
ncbi:MAG: AMP-binding protein [Thermoguttaceae bacterium]